MTREEAKQRVSIIQAFAEGKEIQQTDGYDWYDLDDPDFMANGNSYRIKPGQKYRPFTNVEECWAEMLKHQPFAWVKIEDLYRNIANVTICSITFADNEEREVDYEQAFKNYTFADGMPFGIKVEE